MPSCARRRSSATSRRGAHSASSQRTSSGAAKWIVPRISQVRSDLPLGDGALHTLRRAVGDARPDRPQRLVVILRLHRPEPADDVGGLVEAAGGDALAGDAAQSDAGVGHARRMTCAQFARGR